MTSQYSEPEAVVAESQKKLVSISVVSHGQASLVAELIADIDRYGGSQLELILTLNFGEDLPFDTSHYTFPIRIIRNSIPKGFGANHNAAFRIAHGKYFCVANPDIRFSSDVFTHLVSVFQQEVGAGVVAPLVRSPTGSVEDSARRFPGITTPFLRFVRRNAMPDYPVITTRFEPDWVAGMFMLFPADVYAALGGFNEHYFLYYEDIELCARLRLAGYQVVVEPRAVIVHAARRDSHRKLRYLRWHLSSALRFFTSSVYRRIISRTRK